MWLTVFQSIQLFIVCCVPGPAQGDDWKGDMVVRTTEEDTGKQVTGNT